MYFVWRFSVLCRLGPKSRYRQHELPEQDDAAGADPIRHGDIAEQDQRASSFNRPDDS